MHNCKEKKCYKVLVDSANGTAFGNEGNAFVDYNFDWSVLPDVAYNMTFTFNSVETVITGNRNAYISVGLGQNTNYQVSSQTGDTQARTTAIIGSLRNELMGTDNANNAHNNFSIRANYVDNAPTYLSGRPYNNQFQVKIEDGNGNEWVGNDASDHLGNYVLILNFEEV